MFGKTVKELFLTKTDQKIAQKSSHRKIKCHLPWQQHSWIPPLTRLLCTLISPLPRLKPPEALHDSAILQTHNVYYNLYCRLQKTSNLGATVFIRINAQGFKAGGGLSFFHHFQPRVYFLSTKQRRKNTALLKFIPVRIFETFLAMAGWAFIRGGRPLIPS